MTGPGEVGEILQVLDRYITSERCQEVLAELVGQYSPSQHERAHAERIAAYLRDLDLQVELQDVSADSCNVVGRLTVQGSAYTCLLAGHIDTVPILDGWETDPLRLTPRGNRLYGLGACDMKGGLAGALVALEAIRKSGLTPRGDIVLAGLADEERWSLGAKRFLQDYGRADFCVLCEPGFSQAAIGWPGKILIEGAVKGLSGHAGRPGDGINAIEETARFLAGVGQVPVESHDGLGRHPFAALSIIGGNQTYSLTVPDTCSFTLTKQTVPGESQERVLRMLSDHAASVGLRARLTTAVGTPFYPPAAIAADAPLVGAVQAAFRQVTGSDLPVGYGGGVCDGGYLVGDAGIPTVSFGPSGDGLHKPNEWVSAEQLALASKVYALVALGVR